MKLKITLIFALVISAVTARAQSSYTTIQYKNSMQPALVIDLPSPTSDAEATVIEKLKLVGYNPETRGKFFWKKSKTEGFYIFNDVILSSLDARKLDLYIKVVPKNSTEKNNSILYMLVSTGNGYFPSYLEDSLIWKRCEAFVNGLVQNTADYSLDREIEQQEDALTDSRGKLTRLQSDEKQLADKIRKYENELKTNQEAQQGQQSDIDQQARLLETLKLKRKENLSKS